MRINVVGTSGAGKSTLARRLAVHLNVPYIEMDTLYWRPQWQGTPDAELFAVLETRLAQTEGWVLDGNYNRTRRIKWQNVDVIVWVDYGFWRTFRQAFSRALSRAWRQKELWPGTGNRESFRRSFMSRESIILWTLKTWHKNRKRYLTDTRNPEYAHLHFVRLRNQAETEAFIATLVAKAAA
ncbi:MAG: adenylate kinase [Scandinavium sp.]|uniref:adenylate kinase n=1 Tax=Scandinavium sp. TaxID=2830653 RepID=UPI003F2F22D7